LIFVQLLIVMRQTPEATTTLDHLPHWIGRSPPSRADAEVGPTLQVDGLRHTRLSRGALEETMVIGAACSQVFTGRNLHKVLQPAHQYQATQLESLARAGPAAPFTIHTSAGVPEHLGGFLQALKDHLPWEHTDDWLASLQMEGATAVWAGIDLLFQLRGAEGAPARNFVAVAARSYHGPKTTSLGFPALPRWPGAPRTEGAVAYPVEESSWYEWLEKEGDRVGVMIVEPQWGSSAAGRPWDPAVLQRIVRAAKRRGISVLADEIMCGLGRHGQGTLFLSKAWGLDVDGVTFGKAIGAGVYPISGVALRRGATCFREKRLSLPQSHTYAGASVLALLTATAVLREVPHWLGHVAQAGELCREWFARYAELPGVESNGQGLLWGCLWVHEDRAVNSKAAAAFRGACSEYKVWPYFVPVGGFVLSPQLDVDLSELEEALSRLEQAVKVASRVLAAAAGSSL